MLALLGDENIIVGDLMLCEILQGLESEPSAGEVETLLRNFEIAPVAGEAIAVAAARNCRSLRRRGITIRKTIDLLIGTWCIEKRQAAASRRPRFPTDGTSPRAYRGAGKMDVQIGRPIPP